MAINIVINKDDRLLTKFCKEIGDPNCLGDKFQIVSNTGGIGEYYEEDVGYFLDGGKLSAWYNSEEYSTTVAKLKALGELDREENDINAIIKIVGNKIANRKVMDLRDKRNIDLRDYYNWKFVLMMRRIFSIGDILIFDRLTNIFSNKALDELFKVLLAVGVGKDCWDNIIVTMHKYHPIMENSKVRVCKGKLGKYGNKIEVSSKLSIEEIKEYFGGGSVYGE